MAIKAGENFRAEFTIIEADLTANNGFEIVAPVDGYIMELAVTVQKAVTTGGTITVKTGDALAVTVAGLSAVVANSAARGARVAGASTAASNTRFVTKGSRIQIVTSGFATAGSLNGYLGFNTVGV